MFEKLFGTVSRVTGRTGLAIARRSPEILLITGLVGVVGAGVMACRATLKVEGILDEHQEKMDAIDRGWSKVQSGEIPADRYSEQDHKKDLTVAYVQTGVDFAKIYWPSITLGAFSIFCIISGHGIMKQRNLAIMAAYKAVEESYKAYRKRVVEEHGEEADYMYKNGLRKSTVTELEYTDEDGVKHEQQTVESYVQDPNSPSMYARFFDESCRMWGKDAEYNFFFLKSQQDYWNNILIGRGHVFLNEVYDALGIPRTQAGTSVGWVTGKAGGDNEIDFGIFNGNSPRARAFVNGNERSILLDFNVDGVIWNKI